VLLLIPIPLGVFTAFNTINGTYAREVDTASVAFILVCYVTTFSFYFKVLRIIRQHHQQVEGNQPFQNFGQPAINLAKYKRSVVTIVYILAVFSICLLPITASLAANTLLGCRLATEVATSFSLVLLFLSSSLNPGIYLWRMNDVRRGVKRLFFW